MYELNYSTFSLIKTISRKHTKGYKTCFSLGFSAMILNRVDSKVN